MGAASSVDGGGIAEVKNSGGDIVLGIDAITSRGNWQGNYAARRINSERAARRSVATNRDALRCRTFLANRIGSSERHRKCSRIGIGMRPARGGLCGAVSEVEQRARESFLRITATAGCRDGQWREAARWSDRKRAGRRLIHCDCDRLSCRTGEAVNVCRSYFDGECASGIVPVSSAGSILGSGAVAEIKRCACYRAGASRAAAGCSYVEWSRTTVRCDCKNASRRDRWGHRHNLCHRAGETACVYRSEFYRERAGGRVFVSYARSTLCG